ncbi:DUF4249 domain-containing protein [Algoriphagus sp. AK58]|uniref:DUF4249 domain-containing protein n=1 Tax=Algoriphagus sp. AK58 TaxID=1406877 RepID=UPI00164EE458|nr:DUF4249 domain-containing protein [Algoriphagus sp. AK58]MBC6366389.1 DUF4249 domain-containing protein [Algoriphagus sp. AK58]
MLRRLIYIFFFLPLSCIDPYQVDVPEGEQLLTVEGIISTGPGPHSITLTRSATYGSVFQGLIRPVTLATVVIRDNEGNVTFLTEGTEAKGTYTTPANFRAQIGKSYTLQILTAEGKVYTSTPEKVESVPEIQSVEIRTVTLPNKNSDFPRSGVQLIAEVRDPADQNNFYYWRNGPAVYILETRPDLFTPRPTEANPNRTPQPKACCIQCFRYEISYNQSLFVVNDDNFNGLTTRIPASFIEDDGFRFVNKFRIDLKQYSISQGAYRFLRLVKQQAEISGSIFDPPPATIRGNMISLDNPDEVVLGYFMAAGETSRRIYIDKNDLTFKQNRAIIPDDCRVVPGASVDAPADWNP